MWQEVLVQLVGVYRVEKVVLVELFTRNVLEVCPALQVGLSVRVPVSCTQPATSQGLQTMLTRQVIHDKVHEQRILMVIHADAKTLRQVRHVERTIMADDNAVPAQALNQLSRLGSLSKLFRYDHTELPIPQGNRQDTASRERVVVDVTSGLDVEGNDAPLLEGDVLALPDHPVLTEFQARIDRTEVAILKRLSKEQDGLRIGDDLLRRERLVCVALIALHSAESDCDVLGFGIINDFDRCASRKAWDSPSPL